MQKTVWLIPFFPLFGSIINGLFGSRLSKKGVGRIGCASVAVSLFVTLSIFIQLLSLPPEKRSLVVVLFNWITSGSFKIDFAILIDPLSILMALVVSGVGFLIHIYSVEYMRDDKAYWRYFSFLNLFVFFMLILVLSADYVVMYLGWEGVGLCSYLLIGFWYEKKAASDAGKKAFIVNRIGDFGFILGIFLLFWSLASEGVYSLRYTDVFEHAYRLEPSVLIAITLLLFIGAIGKSAQFPLHVWLPDAMEGPTPVSALIHAATMVTAGVYIVARSNVLFALAPFTGEIIATLGIFTALFAATIGLVQNDIKRVLAYSTISQLGFMFAAMGIGAYAAGIFHLMTHAFFKGLLFLGAGSVIHGMSGDQDMRNMGGLYHRMKITSTTFILGAIAIAGIPPTSGFWSKDGILWEAFKNGHYLIWGVGLFTAFLTAFYIFRQVFMVFFGKSGAEPQIRSHLHESPKFMIIPLIILAALAIGGGWIGIPFFSKGSPLHNFLMPVFSGGSHILSNAQAASHAGQAWLEIILMGLSVAAGLLGILLAGLMYFKPLTQYAPLFLTPTKLSKKFNRIYRLLCNKYYIDEIYDTIIVNPLKRFSTNCLSFDLSVIDGLVNGSGWLTRWIAWLTHKIDIYLVDGLINSIATFININSSLWRRIQTGYLQNYALFFLLALILFAGGMLLIS